MLGLQAVSDGAQRGVVHQVDDELRQRFASMRLAQADEWRPIGRPAPHERLVAQRQAVASRHVAEEETDVGRLDVRAATQRFERVVDR